MKEAAVHAIDDELFAPVRTLLDLVQERLRISEDVAAAKYGRDVAVEDPAREESVLDDVRTQAIDAGLNPAAAATFFQDQIGASRLVQTDLVSRWRAHPEDAPTVRPELGELRERLDQLTTRLLSCLRLTERLRDRYDERAVEQAVSARLEHAQEHKGTSYRQALDIATGSIRLGCPLTASENGLASDVNVRF